MKRSVNPTNSVRLRRRRFRQQLMKPRRRRKRNKNAKMLKSKLPRRKLRRKG